MLAEVKKSKRSRKVLAEFSQGSKLCGHGVCNLKEYTHVSSVQQQRQEINPTTSNLVGPIPPNEA
jgi:hypothetical protein